MVSMYGYSLRRKLDNYRINTIEVVVKMIKTMQLKYDEYYDVDEIINTLINDYRGQSISGEQLDEIIGWAANE